MNVELFKLFLLVLLVIALSGHVVSRKFDDQAALVRSQHQQLIQSQQAVWAQEDVERALNSRAAARVRQEQAAAERLEFFGSPLAAATKNPGLTILQMLTQIANAVAPAGTHITVTVDRFTEFDVAFVLPAPLTVARLALVAQNFLQNAEPYVHSLRFIHGNDLLAELGGADIDSVTNWSTLSRNDVIGLLQGTSLAAPPRGPVTSIGATAADPAEDPESLDPSQVRQRNAQQNFNDQSRRHLRHLNELLAGLNQATRLDNLARDGVPARLAWLEQQANPLNDEEDFFSNQDVLLEQTFNSQGVDPLVTRIVKRTTAARLQPQLPHIAAVFDAIDANQAQIRAFLQVMGRHQGEWEVLADAHKIQFSTPAARADYVAGMDRVKASSEQVQAALLSWEASQAAQ